MSAVGEAVIGLVIAVIIVWVMIKVSDWP